MTVLSLMLISLGILVVRVGDSLTKSPLLQLGMTNWNITTLKAGTGLERRQYLSMRSSHGAQETAGAGPAGPRLRSAHLPARGGEPGRAAAGRHCGGLLAGGRGDRPALH